MTTWPIQTALNLRASAMPALRTRVSRFAVACTVGLALCGLATSAPAQKAVNNYGKLPLSFEPNRGQTDAKVQFFSRGPGYALFLTPGEAVLSLKTSKPVETRGMNGTSSLVAGKTSTLRMQILGANTVAVAQGQEGLPGTVNYFEGSDKSQWKTAIPTYKRVSYTAIYPGIDLVYYGNQRELEYDFVVAPGADPNRIVLGFKGATPRIEAKSGDLMLAVRNGETRFHKPVVYQLDGSRKVPVAGSYTIAANQVHFALGSYDHARTLVIDPVLSYMTYLGGSADDQIHGLAVDAQGNVLMVGTTYSTDFPLKNAYSSVPPLDFRTPTMFVSKFNATGTALIYSTYLGLSTQGNAIAVDPSGNAYVFATTNDSNYPTTPGAYQTICGANYDMATGARTSGCSVISVTGNNSTVVTKISPDGSRLLYSTFLSGSNGNWADAIAVNAAGEAYVTGRTNFSCGSGAPAYFCFPATSNAADPTRYPISPNGFGFPVNGGTVLFFTKFNAQGSGLIYSSLIYDHNPLGHYDSGLQPKSIAIDSSGNAYIAGNASADYLFNTTPGAFQTARTSSGSHPGFVLKFNPAGTTATSLVYSTYLSGTTDSSDQPTGIVVDAAGNAIVTGYTNSCTFPTTAGAFSTVPGGHISQNVCAGGFLTKLNAAGSGLVWSTFTGNKGANGGNNDNNDAVALAPDGSVYVAGDEQGVALSPTVNPIFVQSESHFTYIKHFTADGSAVTFSSAVGGTTDATSIPASIYVDAANNIYLAGNTNSSAWPTTPGAFQKNSASPGVTYSNDGYIVKIAPTITSTTTLTLPTGTVTAGQPVKFTAKVAGPSGTTATPTGIVTFLSGSTTLGTGTLDSTGTATYTATSLNATTYNVTASYPGDTAFAGSVSAAQALVVAPAKATVTLNAPATAPVGASVTLTATVSGNAGTPTGTVIFKDGAATLGMATLSGGTASYSTSTLASGAHNITASYSGDSVYAATVSTPSTVAVSLATPTVTLNAPATALVGAPVTLTVTVAGTGGTPGGIVLFKDGTATLGTATLAAGTASYSTSTLATGAHSITASYSGDSVYAALVSAASTVTVNVPAAISFAAAPASLTITHGQSGSIVITGTPVGGYTGTVTFACGTLPTAASCLFAPAALTFNGSNTAQSTTLTLSTIKSAALVRPVFGRPALAGTSSGIYTALLLLPLGFLLRGRKKGAMKGLLALIVLAASAGAMGLTGCSNSGTFSTAATTPPGPYTIAVMVTASGGNTTLNIPVTVQ